jgi:hypothetical protein
MTAVVGILNKHAIAIAADSAVTIGDGKGRKIFNRANKVFTLSKYHPVGIMIHNSAAFMGTPWETIIKMYRKQLSNKSFPTVKEYQEDFVGYLKSNNYFTTVEAQKSFFYSFACLLIDRILKEIEKANPILFDAPTEENKVYLLNMFQQKCDTYADIFSNDSDPCVELINFTEEECNWFFEEPFQALIENRFLEYNIAISDALKFSLKKFIFCYLKLKETNSNYTGLVFCGFGDGELFPQLIPVNISLVVADRLRYFVDDKNGGYISHKNEGAICPFAQIDVINTILTGIDPTLDSTYLENFEASFTKYNQMILELLGDVNPVLSAQISALDVQLLRAEYVKKNEETKRSNYINPLMSAVSNLSKEDLAEMAESLIYLTYLKRRITFAEESVGGPVDVAIISKGDGFLWIKRKHYFKPELNRYFFDNYFNT